MTQNINTLVDRYGTEKNHLRNKFINLDVLFNEWFKYSVDWYNTYPFLSVRVLDIVDTTGVPLFTNTHQLVAPESTLTHDDKVDEETS